MPPPPIPRLRLPAEWPAAPVRVRRWPRLPEEPSCVCCCARLIRPPHQRLAAQSTSPTPTTRIAAAIPLAAPPPPPTPPPLPTPPTPHPRPRRSARFQRFQRCTHLASALVTPRRLLF